ncbi:MAG TPA: class I SAM-dependent methyltransferase [Myxococcales bacterium]|jgi:SAM-dependent methyltransferase|nr:class I SAM-dependent methyltransferase [Myxococcales bacterium]
MATTLEKHRGEQLRYWKDVDSRHYEWQVGAAYISQEDSALIDELRVEDGQRVLEIGCGEGANLRRLQARAPGARLVGADFSRAKTAFVARTLNLPAICSDATALPIAGGSFDAVLVRDLLHHIAPEARIKVLAEARRVLRPGGRITVIEPNGRNPLVFLQAALIREERGVLRSTARLLRAELSSAGFALDSLEARQPLPVSRAVFHYKYGSPRLAGARPVAWMVRAFERAAGVLPRAAWAYLVAQARNPA